MAITEDTSNQPTAVHAAGTSGTTGSFTPPASRLLVALVAVDGNSGSATTVTVSDTATGTWNLLRRTNSSVTGLGGSAEVWIRDCITSPGAITVTASWSGGGGAVGGNVVVRTLIGAAPVAQQTGATGGASGVPGTVAASVTPNTLGSRIYGAALDYTSAVTMTVNANTTGIDQFVDTTNGDTWAVFKAAADTASLSATSFGYSTSASFNLAAAEILPASSGAAPAWVPGQSPARRRTAPRVQRTRVEAPLIAAPLAPGFEQPRRLRGWLVRRARAFVPPPPQVVVIPPAYPPQSVRTRLRGLRLFRPHVAAPVPAQVVAVPPAYPPAGLRARIRGLRPLRGRAVAPVPQQILPVAPSFVPQPDPRPRFRTRPVRGRIAGPPVQLAPAPLFVRAARRVARVWRGRVAAPVPAQVVLIAPPRAPQATKARRSQFAARRHRGGVDGWMVPGVHVCTTARPNTGTTARTVALTTRPYTGITEEPC